jgi:hypothetical protein
MKALSDANDGKTTIRTPPTAIEALRTKIFRQLRHDS